VGVVVNASRSEGRQGLSLAALGALVEQAMREAHTAGVDPDTIEPVVRTTVSPRPKIRKMEIEIP
jgi:hypothetical protein